MTLVDLHVDMDRVATALEKLVFLLEKLVFPPPQPELKVQQAQLEDLRVVTPEDTDRMREAQERFAEVYRVVPNSSAFTEALLDYEAEQRSIYGEDWEAPDWAGIFTNAYRGTREPAAEAAAPANSDRKP